MLNVPEVQNVFVHAGVYTASEPVACTSNDAKVVVNVPFTVITSWVRFSSVR